MQVVLEAIKFNHDPDSATCDAFNIRKNEREVVTVPEWRRGVSVKPEDSPAAYAISETAGNKISIQAKFRRLDPSINTIEIRAVQPTDNYSISEPGDWIDAIFSLLTPPTRSQSGNVLGRVKRKRISFSDDTESNFETFELENVGIWSGGVSVSTTIWQWQYRLQPTHPWISFDTSSHRIYTVLKMPKGPWLQNPNNGEETQVPWAEVLEYACCWAKGLHTLDEAAALITRGLRNLETTMDLTYDQSSFYSEPDFDCTGFLDLLRNREGQGSKLNCVDCATVVSTFANILGCDLSQGTIDGPLAFNTNSIRLFGRTSWLPATFGTHVVAWKGACTENDELFEACLQVDGDEDPLTAPHEPLLPTNMRFGTPQDRQYFFRMVAPDQPFELPYPMPDLRKRRPIRHNPSARSSLLPRRRLRLLKSHYYYEKWRSTFSSKERLFLRNFLPRAADFPEWEFVGKPRKVVTANRPPVIQVLFRVTLDHYQGLRQLMRLDIDLCKSERAARFFLLQRLGQFDSPLLARREELDVGDVIFTEPEAGSVLFARGNLVVLLRNAGRGAAEFIQLARRFDYQVTSKPSGEHIREMDKFSIPDGKLHVGKPVPLESVEPGFITNQSFKFFATGGYVRLCKDRLVYVATSAGHQKITIFAVDSTGNVLRQQLKAEVLG